MTNPLSKIAAAAAVMFKSAAFAALVFASSAYADGMPKDDPVLATASPDAAVPPQIPPNVGQVDAAGFDGSATVRPNIAPPDRMFPKQDGDAAPAPQRELVRVLEANDPRKRVQEPSDDGLYGYVPPERTSEVTISRRDVNRIHCPVEVTDVFYSKEKPVNVTVAGSDVYVKVLKKVVGGTKEIFDSTPVDLHIVCAESVYTMILLPTDIDSVTLRLGDPLKSKAQSVAKEWGALPIEEKVQRLTRMVYRDELPVSFTKMSMSSDRRTPRMFRNIVIQGVQRVSAPGLGLAALEYEVVAQADQVQLDERDFLNIGLSKTIVGITVDPLVLDPLHRTARLIVIERSLSDGR